MQWVPRIVAVLSALSFLLAVWMRITGNDYLLNASPQGFWRSSVYLLLFAIYLEFLQKKKD